jgi:hypothetical protein
VLSSRCYQWQRFHLIGSGSRGSDGCNVNRTYSQDLRLRNVIFFPLAIIYNIQGTPRGCVGQRRQGLADTDCAGLLILGDLVVNVLVVVSWEPESTQPCSAAGSTVPTFAPSVQSSPMTPKGPRSQKKKRTTPHENEDEDEEEEFARPAPRDLLALTTTATPLSPPIPQGSTDIYPGGFLFLVSDTPGQRPSQFRQPVDINKVTLLEPPMSALTTITTIKFDYFLNVEENKVQCHAYLEGLQPFGVPFTKVETCCFRVPTKVKNEPTRTMSLNVAVVVP